MNTLVTILCALIAVPAFAGNTDSGNSMVIWGHPVNSLTSWNAAIAQKNREKAQLAFKKLGLKIGEFNEIPSIDNVVMDFRLLSANVTNERITFLFRSNSIDPRKIGKKPNLNCQVDLEFSKKSLDGEVESIDARPSCYDPSQPD